MANMTNSEKLVRVLEEVREQIKNLRNLEDPHSEQLDSVIDELDKMQCVISEGLGGLYITYQNDLLPEYQYAAGKERVLPFMILYLNICLRMSQLKKEVNGYTYLFVENNIRRIRNEIKVQLDKVHVSRRKYFKFRKNWRRIKKIVSSSSIAKQYDVVFGISKIYYYDDILGMNDSADSSYLYPILITFGRIYLETFKFCQEKDEEVEKSAEWQACILLKYAVLEMF